jgi:glycerophosphoryl diester phosphodiesterase
MSSEHVEKKPIDSILAALQAYDGCEFDVRFTKDRVVILFHNARFNRRRLLETEFKELLGFQKLEELIHHPRVINLVNEENKTLWIEAKEDSSHGLRKDLPYCQELGKKISDLIRHSRLRLDNVRVISFSPEILVNADGVHTLRIVPYLFSAEDFIIPHYNLKTIAQMFVSLKRHILRTKQMGINGLLFSKLYLRGFFSYFQPSLEEIKSRGDADFILGTEAQTFEEEKAFKDLVVITDYRGERPGRRGENAGPLICHRGL